MTRTLLWLAVLGALFAEFVLYHVLLLSLLSGIGLGRHFAAMFAAAVAVFSAPLFGGVYFARGGLPTVAVIIAWLPSIAVCVTFWVAW